MPKEEPPHLHVNCSLLTSCFRRNQLSCWQGDIHQQSRIALFIGSFFTFWSRMSQLWSYHLYSHNCGYLLLPQPSRCLFIIAASWRAGTLKVVGTDWRLVSMETAPIRKRHKFSRVGTYINCDWPCWFHHHVTDALSSCTGRPVCNSSGGGCVYEIHCSTPQYKPYKMWM